MTDIKLTQYINKNYDEADILVFDQFSQQLFDCSLNDDVQALTVLQRYQIALPLWQTFSSKTNNANKVIINDLEQQEITSHGTALHIITKDKAFLVDSISELIHSLDYKINVFIHPVIKKIRSNQTLSSTHHKQSNEQLNKQLNKQSDEQVDNESVIYIELTNQLNSHAKASLVDKIHQLLCDISAVNNDWAAMLNQIDSVIYANSQINNNYDINSFMKWLGQDNFVFLGHYIFSLDNDYANNVNQTSLGILQECNTNEALAVSDLTSINKELTSFIVDDSSLLVSKSTLKSTIHRHDYYDQINIKEFSEQGKVIAVHRFVGLFTQVANKLSPNKIPYLKFKLGEVLQRLTLKVDSHNYRKFTHILASLPKRELYESNVEQLLGLAKGIYNLNAKSKSGAFIRENEFNQQVSVLVYVSKEAFCTDLRDDIENELVTTFNGKILSRRSMLNDDYLAQWHFIVEKNNCSVSSEVLDKLITRIEVKTQSWNENLITLINQQGHIEQSIALERKYNNAFSKSYQEQFSANEAIEAIKCLEELNQSNLFQFQIYQENKSDKNRLKLNIFTLEQSITLSDSIPILENFDFKPLDEFSFKVQANGPEKSINDLYSYTLEYSANNQIDITNFKQNIEEALSQVWAGSIENDGYNKLLLSANINIRQIVIIRSYGKYLRQLNLGYSEEYFQQALVNYPDIVHDLVSFFETRFALNNNSIAQRNNLANEIKDRLLESLNKVKKIDHDRILRNFIDAISATVRTNFYQTSTTLSSKGKVKSYCSFKIRSGEIEDAPQPRPYVETFVYSPRVEGVHLRFGLVSRGGLRWSDRSEDFRTEILGLVKAQQVKNVVIVPQGAKGGFVPKCLPVNGTREEITNEAITCYKLFISGLLDITDNNTAQGIVKPQEVVCFDDDDSYLVVAADKGTATFSDIANNLAKEYGFWLGDAFASGGSVGYDHKKMGITAKGARVSVQRHFREMNIDVQNDEFTVIGIGDMSGDVFGNGMLSSKTIKLVVAFDHRDIFIDPNPDSSLSYIERDRLYHLPRSSWADYNGDLISSGGGVYSRSLKHIPLSVEVKALLNIDESIASLSPDQLIRYILKSQADLLWFGGIGTYVKASHEINTEVGDKANDTLRINGNELQCKVIGEGGNLGCTQLGRIEFSKIGGKINTDAVDNSAGVNCSDNEVNIKILLNNLVAQQLLTQNNRDALLEEMTTAVGTMVLRNNYYQAQALSIDEANSQFHFDSFTRLTHYLVNSVQLNRALEYLPDDEELQSRNIAKLGLTRPELAVLMAYSKMDVHNALLKQKDLLTDPYFEKYLLSAFPDVLAKQYPQFIVQHPLAQQIIATSVANEIFNRGGIHAVREQTGATISEIVKAFIVAKEVFSLDDIWNEIESLANTVSAHVQIKMMIEVQRFYRLMAIWFINHANPNDDIETIVRQYSPGITTLQQLDDDEITLPFSPVEQSLYQLEKETDSLVVVDKIHQLKVSSVVFCDIVKTAFELKLSVERILPCYCKVSKLVGLAWLIEQTEKVKTSDHWSRLARFSLLLDLLEFREKLVVKIVKSYQNEVPDTAIELWTSSKASDLNRVKRVIDDLKTGGVVHIDKLYFANRQIRALIA